MAVIEVGRDAPPNSPALPALLTRQALAPLPPPGCFGRRRTDAGPDRTKAHPRIPALYAREDAGKSVPRENAGRLFLVHKCQWFSACISS